MAFNPATAAQRIYLMSLTDKNPDIWNSRSQTVIGTVKRRPPRSIYLWDLYDLADTVSTGFAIIGTGTDLASYKTVDASDPFWKSLWVKGLTDDAGSNVYFPVPISFAVSAFNQPDALNNHYQATFSFNPLISICVAGSTNGEEPNVSVVGTQPTETYAGERVIWAAACFPAMPLLVGSSFPEHNHFGPAFARTIEFEASGLNDVTPVEVTVELEGGKPILSPHLPATAQDILPEVTSLNPENDSNSAEKGFRPYRTASFIDCLAATGVFTDVQSLQEALDVSLLSEQIDPQNRIIKMKLSIHQEIKQEAPCPTKGRTDQNGPRFLAVSKREVMGSFTYYSREDRISVPTTEALTMYFGSLFLFPMNHIEWQKPKLDGQAGQGWLHTLNFTARAADNAVSTGFTFEAGAFPVSEFVFPTLESG